MLIIKPQKIYISSANIDMRKGIDGLASIVQQKFELDPFEDAMFVFHNRSCDKIKIIYWDCNGFCLIYKRIEKGKFHFPKKIDSHKYTVTNEEFQWLLNGLKIEEIQRHESLKRA